MAQFAPTPYRLGRAEIMDDLLAAIGKRLRTARETIGISQEELASRAEINTSYLSQIERGLKEPSLSVLSRLAEGVNMTVTDLFTGRKKSVQTRQQEEIARLVETVPRGKRKALMELVRAAVKLVRP